MNKFITLLGAVLLSQAVFSQWHVSPSIPQIRGDAGSFVIGDTGFIVAGSNSWYLQSTWKYHQPGIWQQIANYPNSYGQNVVGFSINDTGYAGTGNYAYYDFTNDFYRYKNNVWTQIASFPGAARSACVAFTIGDTGYVGGGTYQACNGCTPVLYNDFYKYVPATGTWSPIAPCPAVGISQKAVAFSIGDTAYVGLGYKYVSNTWVPQKDFWKYDPSTNTWTQIADYGGGVRRGAASAFVMCNRGFVGTGDSNQALHNGTTDFWEYDPNVNTWTKVASYPGTPHSDGTAFVLGDSAYVGTGGNNTYYWLGEFYRFSATPQAYLSPSPLSVCPGSSITIKDSGSADYTYQWLGTGNTTDSITLNPTQDTTVEFKITLGTCIADSNIPVTLKPLPSVSFTGNDSICPGDSTTITAQGGGTYLWSTGSTNASVVFKPDSNSTYTIAVTNGCTKDTSVVIAIRPLPVITLSGNTSVCPGDSVLIKATGGGTYLWSNNSTNDSTFFAPDSATTYTLHVNNGCLADTSFTITTLPLPVPGISQNTSICQGNFVSLSASGGSSYVWNTGQTSDSIFVSPPSTTTYTVTISNGSCSATDSAKVTVVPFPPVTANGTTTITSGQITPLIVTPGAGDTYLWTPSSSLSCDTCRSPNASPTVTTWYYVTVTDSDGCSTTDSVLVTVKENCGSIYLPNAFSPNNDGYNDVLYVYGDCIKDMDLNIYDRWGNKVFESNNINEGWDGKYNGQPMNAGTYVYTLTVTDNNNNTTTKKGNITLVR